MRRLITAGEVAGGTLVWKDGMPEWTEAKKVGELWNRPAPVHSSPVHSTPVQSTPFRASPVQVPPVQVAPVTTGVNYYADVAAPTGRATWAIPAFVLGLLSICMIPAPLAVVASVVAIREMWQDRRKGGMAFAVIGLVLGIIGSFLLFLMILGFIVEKGAKK